MDPKLPQQPLSERAEASPDAAQSKLNGERQRGAIGWAFLWLIGIPIPILLLLFFVRGCT